MENAQEVAMELPPFIRIYKDGRVERLIGNDTVTASLDPHSGVSSKDVVILPESVVSARIYLPQLTDQPRRKLPILVYFHGGGFCIESAKSPRYHNYINSLVAEASVICVSVEYRRAPEHPLPTAYDDCWAALQWVASHSHSSGSGFEPWLTEHADYRRLFLAGDSAGANIAHQMAVRSGGAAGLGCGVAVLGIVLVHPFFWGSQTVGGEAAHPGVHATVERLWLLACPSTTAGVDDPLINPVGVGAPDLSGLGCRRVLIIVAGNDSIRHGGLLYYEALSRSGWDGVVEILESEGESHVFHLFNHTCDNAIIVMKRLVSFLGHHS